MSMVAPLIVTPIRKNYEAKRRPIEHRCGKCGHNEMIVPPCGKGEMVWHCLCGMAYRITFAGEGAATHDSIYKGLG
jgi:hypothetical protein